MLAQRYNEAVIRDELKRRDLWWDVLMLDGKMTGYAGEVHRLTDSLQVDTSRIRSQLHWAPPVSFERGMLATVSAMTQADQEMRTK